MDDCTSTSSPVSLSAREGDDGGGVGKGEKREREWAREKRMKELLLASEASCYTSLALAALTIASRETTTTGTHMYVNIS